MASKTPVLLNFSALRSANRIWIQGQVIGMNNPDFNLPEMSLWKHILHLWKMYRAKPCANSELKLQFSQVKVELQTNSHGHFSLLSENPEINGELTGVSCKGERVICFPELYPMRVEALKSRKMLVTDIDDTLLQTHITKPLRKLMILLFTRIAKRRSIYQASELINHYSGQGAQIIYLSNSEHNLFPLIRHFLLQQDFPHGPVFLKFFRTWTNLFSGFKLPLGKTHKTAVLHKLAWLNPQAQLSLVGDDSQEDLAIYLSFARWYPKRVKQVIIRQVLPAPVDSKFVDVAKTQFHNLGVEFLFVPYYKILLHNNE
ncbi:MAG: phosphatase domain-containing protein [Luteibaculum sp.]